MSISGYIAGFISAPIGAATGNVSITGSIAAIVNAFTGSLNGSVSVIGSVAATIKKPTAALVGGFPIVGSIAATVSKPVGGCNPVNIPFRFKSRPLYYSDKKNQFAEIIFAIIFCEFNDTLNYDVMLLTDKERYIITISYDEDERVVSALAAAGRPYFRKFIQGVPPPGAIGSFFQVEINKTVHHLNGYKFIGVDIYAADRPGVGPEFIAGDATLVNGWS